MEGLRDNYSQLAQFEKLNALEMILMGKAVPELRASTLKRFEDKDECLRVDARRMDRLFQTALASKALQRDESAGSLAHKSKGWARRRGSGMTNGGGGGGEETAGALRRFG